MKKKFWALLVAALMIASSISSNVAAAGAGVAPVTRSVTPFLGSRVCYGSYLSVAVAHADYTTAGFAYAVGEAISGATVLSHTADAYARFGGRDWFLEFIPGNDVPERFTYLLRVTAPDGGRVEINGLYRDFNDRWNISTEATVVPVTCRR